MIDTSTPAASQLVCSSVLLLMRLRAFKIKCVEFVKA